MDAIRNVEVTEVELSKDGDSMELDDAIDCDLDGLSFECVLQQEEDVDGYDATLVSRVEVEGEWTSSKSFDSNWSLEASCRGSDCGDLSDNCVVTWTIEGELDE